ncbi:ankyrin repeat domain protein [Leptospira kirschneri str. H2]|nr:ankyrin repeat domain protein [Leptospira kirschneri str. H2]
MWAVSQGDLEMTSLLLGQGANLNAKGLANTSPLIYASMETNRILKS